MDSKISQLWKKTKKNSKKVYKDFWNHDKHSKKVDKWVSKLNSALVILIIGMVVLGAFWHLGGFVRDAIEDFIEDRLISNLIDAQQLIFEGNEAGSRINAGSGIDTNGRLIGSSFTDLFSGVGWINQDETTLYHDKTATAFLFPPNFDWSRVEEQEVDLDKFIEKRDDGSDKRCIDDECLLQKDKSLYFGNQSEETLEDSSHKINLPEGINLGNLVNVTVGSLDSRWLVGFVEEAEEDFIGKVYYFDEGNFNRVFDEEAPFKSEYEGKIGFGGSDNNFLVIYGGFTGSGYHVIPGEKQENISELFGIRLMNDGFHPQAIKGDDGDWYIYSLTPGNTRLIKLFQNGTDSIRGVVNLTNLISISRAEKASFYLSEEDFTLFAKISSSGNESNYWKFVDKGFDKSNTQVLFSSDINNNPSEVREASIESYKFSDVGGDVSFYMSNNQRDWFEVDIGQTIEFPDKKGNHLIWKVEANPDTNQRTTPFLDLIRLKYRMYFF